MSKQPTFHNALLTICLVCGYILLPFSNPWFPQTADGEYYSARLGGFYTSILKGQIPPRWAPTLFSGLGSPVFNFNYPMPNVLGSLFLAFGSTIETAIKLTIVLSYLAGGIGAYLLFKSIFKHPLSPFVGSLLYTTAPYQLHDIFHRATTGEIMMFGLLPYVLMVIKKTAAGKFHPTVSALIYAVYFLTHNLYSLMFLPLIIAFVQNFYPKKTFQSNLRPIIAGLLISLFFWLPALLEMKFTVLSDAWINQVSYATELLSLRQTLKLPGLYQPKNDPPTLDSAQPGFAQLFGFVAAALVLIFSAKSASQKNHRFALISLAFFVAGLFLINQTSLPLWQLFSPVRFIQHPIRLYFIPVFFGAYLGAFVIEQLKTRWVIAIILLGLTIYNYRFFAFRPVSYVPIDDAHYYNYPLSTAADNEFDPIWYDRQGVNHFFIQYNYTPLIATPSAAVTIVEDGLYSNRFRVINSAPTTIIEETLYFPGWETMVNGRPIDILTTAGRHHGLINYDLPPGEHEITTRFTQQTPARRLGNGLSLLGLIYAISFIRLKKSL